MKDLNNRTLTCDCGLTINRDYNAAINIKNEGLRILLSAQTLYLVGQELSEPNACGHCVRLDCILYVIKRWWLKQEARYFNAEQFTTKYSEEEQREVSELIRWHMIPYYWEKKGNEKMRNKYFNLWGEKLYEKVMLLHSADKEAH